MVFNATKHEFFSILFSRCQLNIGKSLILPKKSSFEYIFVSSSFTLKQVQPMIGDHYPFYALLYDMPIPYCCNMI